MKYALIIGNSKYDDPKLAQLKTPAADSQALAKVLDDKTIGGFDSVTPLINQNETRVRIAISEFLTNKKPDDLVLLYFSGHGILDDRGRLYLALKDTQVNLLKATSLPSSFLADEMDSCRSKRQILILDCCHSGAFARGAKGEQKAVTEATFEGSGFGRVVLTASDSTQYALEGDQVLQQTEFSLFTHFLLDGLRTGQADLNNDGQVSLDEWYDYTYGKVISETPRQVPHKWSYNQQGDLVIARNPFVQKKVAELPFELIQALESSFVGIRESAVGELGKYLKSRDPDMVDLAVSALRHMKEDDSRRISSLAEKLLADFEPPHSPMVDTPVLQTADLPVASPVEVTPLPERPRDMKPASPAAPERLAASVSTPWLKWLGTIALGIVLSVALGRYYYSVGPELYVAALVFAAGAAVPALVQWLLLRDKFEGWWVAVNAVTGLGLGRMHEVLYQHANWEYKDFWIVIVVWNILHIAVGLLFLRSTRAAPSTSIDIPRAAYRKWFALLFILSLIVGNLASVISVWIGVDYARVVWVAYGILAILTSLAFWWQRPVWNFGWVVLAAFLLVDGINTGLLGLAPDKYYLYYFAIGGILAWVSGIFFAFHTETWRTLRLLLLTGYLLAVGLANLLSYETYSIPTPLLVAGLSGILAAILFLVHRQSTPVSKNAGA